MFVIYNFLSHFGTGFAGFSGCCCHKISTMFVFKISTMFEGGSKRLFRLVFCQRQPIFPAGSWPIIFSSVCLLFCVCFFWLVFCLVSVSFFANKKIFLAVLTIDQLHSVLSAVRSWEKLLGMEFAPGVDLQMEEVTDVGSIFRWLLLNCNFQPHNTL